MEELDSFIVFTRSFGHFDPTRVSLEVLRLFELITTTLLHSKITVRICRMLSLTNHVLEDFCVVLDALVWIVQAEVDS